MHTVSFPKLGLSFDLNPVAFSIGSINVTWYGIIIAAGILLALLMAFKNCKRFGVNGDKLVDVVIGGLIGAAAIVLIGQLGYVAAISGMVLGYCTIGGYRRGAGKLSALGIAVSVVVMLAAVYLGNRMDIAIAASRELDLSFGQAFAWMHELVDADAYRSNLITLYLFSAIGAVPAAFSAHKIAKEKGRVYRIGE